MLEVVVEDNIIQLSITTRMLHPDALIDDARQLYEVAQKYCGAQIGGGPLVISLEKAGIVLVELLPEAPASAVARFAVDLMAIIWFHGHPEQPRPNISQLGELFEPEFKLQTKDGDQVEVLAAVAAKLKAMHAVKQANLTAWERSNG